MTVLPVVPGQKLTSVLKRHPLFEKMSDSDLYYSLDFMSAELVSCEKGELLISAGQPLRRFGIVLSGAVQVYKYDIDGNRMIMNTVEPGVSFGESHCFLGTPDPELFIEAVLPGEILRLDADCLRHCAPPCDARRTELMRRFMMTLAQRTLSMNSRIQILSKLTLRAKLVAYFTECAAAAGSKLFTVPLDRNAMAEYLGVNRSALSRELSNMKKDGIIEYYRNTFKYLA